jgi:uncharacterized protein (UPF0332 family)
MTPGQRDLMDKAVESLKAAKVLCDGGFYGFAASRAYYTMFYVAEAFLEGEGLSFSKHSAVISFFGKNFAKTGKVPAEFHGYLHEAEEIRLQGDYSSTGKVGEKDAREQIERAEMFIEMAMKNWGPLD